MLNITLVAQVFIWSPNQTTATSLIREHSDPIIVQYIITGGITLKNVFDLSVLHSYLHQITKKTLIPDHIAF